MKSENKIKPYLASSAVRFSPCFLEGSRSVGQRGLVGGMSQPVTHCPH